MTNEKIEHIVRRIAIEIMRERSGQIHHTLEEWESFIRAQIERLTNALQASESLKRGYLDEVISLRLENGRLRSAPIVPQQPAVTAQCVATHMGGSHCIGRCMMPKDCCGTPLAK